MIQIKADVVYSLFASQFLANLALLAIGLAGMRWWVKVIEVPRAVLSPCIVALCFVGAYSVSGNLWDVGTVLVFGVIGYVMRKLHFPVTPAVLALILGNVVETNYRRMLLVSEGDLVQPLSEPIVLALLALALFTFFYPMVRRMREARKSRDS